MIPSRETGLSGLDGKKLDGYSIKLANVSAGRYSEAVNFELYLVDQKGTVSDEPLIRGTLFGGRGESYRPWIEFYFREEISFNSSETLKLTNTGILEAVFAELAGLIPAGGHIMVPYVHHEETRNGLELGIPAPATPIGYLLWRSGCTWFKDWYFAEGGREGDVKLQGEKPLDDENKEKDLLQMRKELTKFLGREKINEKIFLDARKRAENLLTHIEREISGN